MSGVYNSVGGFLGTSSGPGGGPAGNFNNQALGTEANEQGIYQNPAATQALLNYSNGTESSSDVLGTSLGGNGAQNAAGQQGLMNALATGATTGSQYAAEQVGDNATQNSLYGQNGQLGNTENLINQEEQVGTQLNPTSNTLYGQEAGQIANQFAQQGNQAAQSLASRGLSDSGAAGATFSGIAGNQNQMLANAQEQIGQQQFSNAQQQLQNNMNYASQLGGQYNNALNQQYGRQLSGAQAQESGLSNAANQTAQANNSQNQYNQSLFNQSVKNTPVNLGDYLAAGTGSGLYNGLSNKVAGTMGASGSMFQGQTQNGIGGGGSGEDT